MESRSSHARWLASDGVGTVGVMSGFSISTPALTPLLPPPGGGGARCASQGDLLRGPEDGDEQEVAAEQEVVSPSSPSPDRRKSFSMSRSSTVETAETILRWSDALLSIYLDSICAVRNYNR